MLTDGGVRTYLPFRAPYASDPARSRGRLHAEPESRARSPFQRDRDRIIHSGAFRRLKHKTQVFVYHEGDYYRTRLTHSLEVSQIARSIARELGLDEDLAEALALAHDLGHTCFGHAGEEALDACMKPYGGFDHNAHALRLVTKLETRYAAFDGLNLTWETLEGLVKHNGPLVKPGRALADLPEAIREYEAVQQLELAGFASLEAQVAALSDDIAYNNHDIDDGLRAGLFAVDDLLALPLTGDVFKEVLDLHPGIERTRLIHESVRRLINVMVNDLVAETRARIAGVKPGTVDDVRSCGQPLAGFSAELEEHGQALRAFLFRNMYRHWRVNRMTSKARRVVTELFELFVGQPNVLPGEWSRLCAGPKTRQTARIVSDYIAGMTDRFAIEEHSRLFDMDVHV